MVDVIERVSDFGGEADGGGSDDDNRKKQPSLDDLFLSSSFDEEDGDEEDGVDDEKEDNSGLASDADANQVRCEMVLQAATDPTLSVTSLAHLLLFFLLFCFLCLH